MTKKAHTKKPTISIREWLKSFGIVVGTLTAYLLFSEFVYWQDKGGLFRTPDPSLRGFNTVFSLVVLYVIIRYWFISSHLRLRDAGLSPIIAYAPIAVYLILVISQEASNFPEAWTSKLTLASFAIVGGLCCFKKRRAEQDGAGQPATAPELVLEDD